MGLPAAGGHFRVLIHCRISQREFAPHWLLANCAKVVAFGGTPESAMNCARRCLFSFLILIAMVPNRWAHAQTINRHEIATMLSSKIMRSLRKHHGGASLQAKVIRRMAECALLYGVLSRQAPDENAQQGAALISKLSKDILFQISAGVSMDEFKKLSKEAHDLVIGMSKPQNKRSLHGLLRNCQSLINIDEIDEAVEGLVF